MTNFALPSHVSKRWVVSVETPTGETLSPADFEFFGAATAPGAGAVAMRSTPGETQTVLTLSPLGQAGTWHYSIFCRQKLTAVTWQVAAGQISVTPSPCLAQPSLDPDPGMLTAMLDPETLQVTVTLGDSVAATAAAAQQATQAAAAALDSQAEASQSAADAQASETAAAQSATDAQASQATAAQSAADAQSSQTSAAQSAADAQVSKTAAAQSATEAQTSKTAAAQSATEAQASKTSAAQSATDAQASKAAAAQSAVDAQSSQTSAAQSAADAQASQTAAAQSAADAQASKAAAAQSADDAETAASKLGDAALQSGNNAFTGENSFTGLTLGVLPADVLKFAWVADASTLAAVCKDLQTLKSWYFYTPKLLLNYGFNGGGIGSRPSMFEDMVFYSEVAANSSAYIILLGSNNADMSRLVVVLTAYTGLFVPVSNNRVGGDFKIDTVEIYAPHATCYGFRRAKVSNWLMVSANSEIDETVVDVSSSASTLLRLSFPLNVLTRVVLTKLKALREVLTGFPNATVINFQQAVLDKASVLRIVSSLKGFDAASMPEVPQLTLGIDPTLDGDEEINSALLNAQTSVAEGGKGWNVAVSGFTITAGGAATMSLRKPVYARRWSDAAGVWVDADGTRWSVRYGNTVLENWVANEQLGYEEFATLDDALSSWGLTEYVPPENENI